MKRFDRRDWLKTAGLGALGAGTALASTGCGTTETKLDLARVKVSPEREIRTTVGLRPFRPSGFRVETETLDQKTVVHNYGHGGSGMSLSWGSSHMAVELARAAGSGPFAIIGCGVMGLSCGRLLQKHGHEVTIYSKELPPANTSSMSAAWWSPGAAADPGERTPEYDGALVKAQRFANRYFQNYLGDDYGVHWRRRFNVSEDPIRAGSSLIGDLFPETRDLAPDAHPFPWPYVQQSWTMVIEPPRYLNHLLQDFRLAGGKVVVRAFNDRDEVLGLAEPIILNCSGLGARELFEDESLTPIKGQLTVLLPQPELDYMMVGGGLYMIPRADGVVLGATHERGEWSLEPSRNEANRVMEGHIDFWSRMA